MTAPGDDASFMEPPTPDASRPEAAASGAAPTVEEAATAGPTIDHGFELPSARQVVGRGLQLALDSTSEVRRASIYVGLLLLALVAPVLLLATVDLPYLGQDPFTSVAADRARQALVTLQAVGVLAGLGAVAVLVDGGLVATALLAARAVGRPYTLREAVRRARQVFWRFVVASAIVTAVSEAVSFTVTTEAGLLVPQSGFGTSLVLALLGTIVGLPFGYVLTGVVIGDAGGVQALGRSFRLVRARPLLAVVLAAFVFLTQTIEIAAIGAAAGVLEEIQRALGPSVDLLGNPWVVLALLCVATVAIGSLIVTMTAISSAPQVAAFLGLTHYDTGLDLARMAGPSQPAPVEVTAGPESVPPASPWIVRPRTVGPTRLVTVPMIGLAALEVCLAIIGVVAAGGGSLAIAVAPPSDPMQAAVVRLAGPGMVSLSGDPSPRADPLGDQAGGAWKQADLRAGEVAFASSVPTWVTDQLFACDAPAVACDVGSQGPSAFEQGAYLLALQVAQDPATLNPGDVGDWGVLLDLPGQPSAPTGNDTYALAATVYVIHGTVDGWTIHRLAYENGGFQLEPTAARATWSGDTMLVLVPVRLELGGPPAAWDEFAVVSGQGVGAFVTTRDWLRPDDRGLIPFGTPATVTFSRQPSAV